MYTPETFIDMASDEIVFRDNSKLKLFREKIVLDLQQLHADGPFKNFKLEIFEVVKTKDGDDALEKISKLEEINKLFHIKTDENVIGREVESRSSGHYKRGEDV